MLEDREPDVVPAGISLSLAPQQPDVLVQPPRKDKRESPEADVASDAISSPIKKPKLKGEPAIGASLEDDAVTDVQSESASQALSSFMRACGNNPDPSVPRTDQ